MHREAYPFLSFGRAAEFAFEYGINDADWLAREQADEALTDDGSQGSLVLV
jgi:hypothetical protein